MADQYLAFKALADATRREVFERLAAGPKAVGELADELPVTRPAVSQHLKALKSAGLVTERREGTRRVYQIDPAGLGADARVARPVLGYRTRRLSRRSDPHRQTRGEARAKEQEEVSRTIQPAPVRKVLTVPATPQRAFEVFTAGFDRWWPRSHTIGKSALQEVVLEPRVGGRWYGIDDDGTETEWGDVLVWEPPGASCSRGGSARTGSTTPTYSPKSKSRSPRKAAARRGSTSNTACSRRMGDAAAAVRDSIDGPGGWTSILQSYADVVRAG